MSIQHAADTPSDFSIVNHGSVYMLAMHTDAAHQWAEAHIQAGALHMAGAIAVEPRYAHAIIEAIQSEGMVLS